MLQLRRTRLAAERPSQTGRSALSLSRSSRKGDNIYCTESSILLVYQTPLAELPSANGSTASPLAGANAPSSERSSPSAPPAKRLVALALCPSESVGTPSDSRRARNESSVSVAAGEEDGTSARGPCAMDETRDSGQDEKEGAARRTHHGRQVIPQA